MKHRDCRREEGCLGETGADMLGRALHRRIDSVEIQRRRVGDITRHHRTLEEMDIVHILDDPRRVIDVGKIGFAIAVVLDINDMDRRTGGAEMNARTGQQHVVPWILSVQRDISRRHCQHVVDKRAREAHTPVITGNGTSRRHTGNPAVRRLAEADFLEDLIDRAVDGPNRRIIKRAILTTCQAGPDRSQFRRQRCGAFHTASGAATGAA